MFYYIVKDCEWCSKRFEQRAGNTIGRRTCSPQCRLALKQHTISHAIKLTKRGVLRMSMVPSLEVVVELRKRNADVFFEPTVDQTFNYIHEETGELWRVAQRMFAPEHLRGHELDIEEDIKKHLEWGQAIMMLFTAAVQMNIDPDRALQLALDTTDMRCAKKRAESV